MLRVGNFMLVQPLSLSDGSFRDLRADGNNHTMSNLKGSPEMRKE